MGSPALTPAPPAGPPPQGDPGAGAGAGAPPAGGGGKGATAQKIARLRMDAQSIAADAPETAPMMRAIDEQLNKASMQLIQTMQRSQQASPQI